MKSVKILALAAAVAALSAPAAFAQTAQTGKPVAAADDELKAVKLFVRKNSGDPYPYGGQIQIGHPVLDAPDVFRKVPAFPQYSFANLDSQLVVIDSATRKVVAIF